MKEAQVCLLSAAVWFSQLGFVAASGEGTGLEWQLKMCLSLPKCPLCPSPGPSWQPHIPWVPTVGRVTVDFGVQGAASLINNYLLLFTNHQLLLLLTNSALPFLGWLQGKKPILLYQPA